jgi:hypothetical protein
MGDGLGRVKGSNGPSDMVDLTRVVEGKEVKEKKPECRRNSMADVDRLFSVTFRNLTNY